MMLLPRIDCILDSRLLTLFTVIEVNSRMRFQSPLTDNIHIHELILIKNMSLLLEFYHFSKILLAW